MSPPLSRPEVAVTPDHLSLQVADLEVSARFYKNALGLTEIPSPVPGLRWFHLGDGLQLHLLPQRRHAVRNNRAVHFALRVESLDDFLRKLQLQDVEWFNFKGENGAVGERPDGVRQIYVRDPDGYWIELNDRH